MINAKRFGRGQLPHPARGRVDKALQPRHLFFQQTAAVLLDE